MDKVLGFFIYMECKVFGLFFISVQWFKDGKEIFISVKYRLVCYENIVLLEVSNLELEDIVNYICKVFNVVGDNVCSGILIVKGQSFFVFFEFFFIGIFKIYYF